MERAAPKLLSKMRSAGTSAHAEAANATNSPMTSARAEAKPIVFSLSRSLGNGRREFLGLALSHPTRVDQATDVPAVNP